MRGLRLLVTAGALFALPGAPAQAAPVLRAWSDAAPLRSGELRRSLELQRQVGCRIVPKVAAPRDLADALKRAETWLGQNAPGGVRAFAASPESKSAALASQAALEASLSGHPAAALAALLTAHRLAPKNAEIMVNLGGALALFGLGGEALTVLAAAEKLPTGVGALGWPGRASLLNNRGYALLRLGRHAEAETALSGASRLAPNLAEAQTNLARALACQGKLDQAVIAARRGSRRTAAETAKHGTPVPPEAVVELPQPVPGEDAPDETHRPASSVFDVSRGRGFNLPNLKLPQTPADAVALLPVYQKLRDDLRAQDEAISARQQALQLQLRARAGTPRLVEQRRNALLSAIYRSGDEPRLARLWQAEARAEQAVSDIWTDFWHCSGGCKIDQFIEQASASTDYTGTLRALCVPALQSANNSWRGAMHAHTTELAKAAEASYRLETGLAANYSDPLWHELASLQAEKGALSALLTLVGGAERWSADVTRFKDGCVASTGAPPAPDKVAEALTFDRTASCKELFGTAALKASFKIVEISVACETVALKASTPGWVGAFGKLEKNFMTDDVTVSAGAEAGVTMPGTVAGVKGSAGFYLTVDGAGELKDLGTLAEANATAGLKIGDGKSGAGAKLSGKWSLLPSVATY